MKKLIISIVVFFLAGCGRGISISGNDGEVLYTPLYSSGFTISAAGEGSGSTILTITDPWQGASDVEIRLFLSRNGEQPSDGFQGISVRAPLRKVVCMSSSYVAFLDELGETDAIKGVSGAMYITNDTVRARYSRGEIRDVGYDSNVNYELLAALDPDLILLYGVSGDNSTLTRKLDELGLKYIYIGEYVEQSPLGKAEWLIAFGEMFDKREYAKEKFEVLCEEYTKVKSLIDENVTREEQKPSVMLNTPYRDTWFVPGDRSYMVTLINDAGGIYSCRGNDSEQSRPINIETAFVAASRSDIWMNPGQASTLSEVKTLNPRFASIPAVINDMVYNNNRRSTPDGGSDFWESGTVRPDIVLKDMATIFHPGLIPDHKLYYFQHLE